MKKIRIGNDIKINWSITNKKDGSPYNLEGKNLKLYFGTYGVNEEQTEFTVSENVISWTFYGKDQKKPGDYHLTLVENQGEKGMVTLDACNPFGLVPTSCMVGGESSCGNVSIETVEIQSEVDIIQTGSGGVSGSVSWGDIEGKPSNFADWNVEEGNEKFISNKPVIPSKTSELQNDSNFATKDEIPDTSTFITNAVDNLTNYYLKSETYTKEEVADLISKITTINFKVVEELPVSGESNLIYLVKKEGSGNDVHDEYIWVESKWEKIGSTTVDLTNYYTKTDADGRFALKTDLSVYLTKTDAESTYQPKGNYLTEESDPTVPSWAKEPQKPTYTAEEVGAIAKGGLKTVNGQTLEGEGNIEIQGSGGGIPDAPADGKKYLRSNNGWVEETKVDTSSFATKEELNTKLDTETYNEEKAGFATKQELQGYVTTETAEQTYAKKGDIPEAYTLPTATAETLGGVKVGAGLSINPETGVLSATGGGTADSVDWSNITSKPDFKAVATTGSYNDLTDKPSVPSKTSELTNDSGFLTTVPEEYVTETELQGKGYSTKTDLDGKQDKGDYALKSEIPDVSGLATKQEVTEQLSSKVDVSAIADMETKTNAAATYQPKGNYATKEELSGYLQTTTAEETYAKKSDIPSTDNFATKQDLKGKADKTAIADMLTKEEASTTYQPIGDYATTEALTKGLQGKADTTAIPTKLSQLTNDSNYLTDAPSDGNQYGRKDGAWAVIEAGTQYLDLSMFSSESGTLSDEDYQKVVKAYDDKVTIGYAGGIMFDMSLAGNEEGYEIVYSFINVSITIRAGYIGITSNKMYNRVLRNISLQTTSSGTKALTDNGQYADFAKPTKVESGGSGTVTKQLKPNTFYKFGSCSKLTITFAAEESGIENEYKFEFVSGSTPTTLSLPDSVKWSGGSAPTIEANKTYQVSIVNKLAVFAAF